MATAGLISVEVESIAICIPQKQAPGSAWWSCCIHPLLPIALPPPRLCLYKIIEKILSAFVTTNKFIM